MPSRFRAMLLLFVAGCAGQSGTGSGTTPAESPETLGNIAKAEPGSVAAAVASASRSPENRARDRYRHPTETLTFFEIEPDMHVLEIRPGSGWYTEILATYLAETGRLSVGIPSADGPRAKYRARFIEAQQSRPDVFGGIDVVVFDPPAPIELGPDASVDLIVTFRNTHNWISDGGAQQAYAAFFEVLRPGGVLGVVQHRADEGVDPKASAATGYVPESYVIALAEQAGFELVGGATVNRNPKDNHEHPEGVWTLPPVLRLGDQDQAEYLAIGESDRMTLKFRKPLVAPAF